MRATSKTVADLWPGDVVFISDRWLRVARVESDDYHDVARIVFSTPDGLDEYTWSFFWATSMLVPE